MSRPRLLARLLALTLVGLGLIAVGELTVRLLGIEPQRSPPPAFLALQEDGSWVDAGMWGGGRIKRPSPFPQVQMGEYTPGATFKVVYGSNPRGYFDDRNGVDHRINGLGMRGREVSAEKASDRFRILGLGDSFTFGRGVRDEHTFLHRVEVALNERGDFPVSEGTTSVEVLNAAVSGYNTQDELIYLENRHLALDPDLVLVVFYMNDAFADEAIFNNGETVGTSIGAEGWLAEHSQLWDLLQHRARLWSIQKKIEELYLGHFFSTDFIEGEGAQQADWVRSREAFARMADLSRERDFELAIVVFPELHQLDEDYPFREIHALVMRTAAKLGIPALDLFEVFEGADAEALWVHVSDHHPNELAHEMAAEAIADFLVEEGFGRGRDAPRPAGTPAP